MRSLTLALLLALSAVPAMAQEPPAPSPDAQQAAPPAPAPKGRAKLLRGMALPFEHVEGSIAFLKAELHVTDAQMPQWGAFADALRAGAASLKAQAERATANGLPTSAPDRAKLHVDMLAVELDAARSVLAAGTALYAVLSAEQKRVADQWMSGPAGRAQVRLP